jgi:phenylacetate-CoA ligase
MERLKPLFKILGVIAYFMRYRYTQYWSKAEIQKYQLKRLRKQLIQAKKTEYYKKLFEELNFDPTYDFHSFIDLEKIPITTKELVRNNSSNFLVPNLKKFSFRFKTSGSTGKPMAFYIHPIHWIVEQAVIYRHWKWGGYNIFYKTAMLRSYSPSSGEPLYKFNWLLNTYYFSPFHLTDENMLDFYKIMVKKKIRVLRGYPSSIKIFVLFLEKYNLKELNIKEILTASEVLSDKDRFLIERVTKAKISNHYGLAEQIVMFGDCERHHNLHNYFEYGYVELIETETPGIKKIIGTNLHNQTMPLIRYDTGDLAIITDKKCHCGRISTEIKNVIGRQDLAIQCPNGYEIPSVNFYTMLEHFLNITQWQIVYDAKKLTLRIKSTNELNSFEKENIHYELEKRLEKSGFSVEIVETETFVKKNEGKLPVIVKM